MTDDYDLQYSDNVRVAADARPAWRPGEPGSVCGFRELAEESSLDGMWLPLGTLLVLVEFSDGTAVEVPRSMLELDDDA